MQSIGVSTACLHDTSTLHPEALGSRKTGEAGQQGHPGNSFGSPSQRPLFTMELTAHHTDAAVVKNSRELARLQYFRQSTTERESCFQGSRTPPAACLLRHVGIGGTWLCGPGFLHSGGHEPACSKPFSACCRCDLLLLPMPHALFPASGSLVPGSRYLEPGVPLLSPLTILSAKISRALQHGF